MVICDPNSLRINDSPALYRAQQESLPYMFLYICSESGTTSLRFSYTASIVESFKRRCPKLHINDINVLSRLKADHNISQVFTNLSPHTYSRNIVNYCIEHDIKCTVCQQGLLKSWDHYTKTGKVHCTFTSFLTAYTESNTRPLTQSKPLGNDALFFKQYDKKPVVPAAPHKLLHYYDTDPVRLPVTLDFVKTSVVPSYDAKRDILYGNHTSGLSHYLAAGIITTNEIRSIVKSEHSFGFVRQLLWREYSYYLHYHYPHMHEESVCKRDYTRAKDEVYYRLLNAWIHGRTGYELIDAIMMQLKYTGYINNRMRLIVSSFLTRNMRISWYDGYCHFMNYLIDADESNNSMGWQWISGNGRAKFNPTLIIAPHVQQKKFDPNKQFINIWSQYVNSRPDPIIDWEKSCAEYRATLKSKS